MAVEPQRIFISYSRDVGDVASRLAADLRARGLVPWLAKDDLEPGQSFADQIREGIESSDAIAVVVGNASSPVTRFEQSEIVKHGWEHEGMPVVPVLVDDAVPPGFLSDRMAARVDRETGSGLDDIVDLLSRPAHRWTATRTAVGTARLNDRLDQLDAEAAASIDVPER